MTWCHLTEPDSVNTRYFIHCNDISTQEVQCYWSFSVVDIPVHCLTRRLHDRRPFHFQVDEYIVRFDLFKLAYFRETYCFNGELRTQFRNKQS